MNLIIKEIRNKNKKVFQAFFKKNYANFVTYANGYLFDKAASEDLVQEVFIYLWENAGNINITHSLEGYLYVAIKNRCLNYLKCFNISDNLNVLEFNIHLVNEHSFLSTTDEDKTKTYQHLIKIIEQLPEKMQQVVKLRFLYNYKYAEIAKEMNISVNTVKTQLKRAKERIAQLISLIIIALQIQL